MAWLDQTWNAFHSSHYFWDYITFLCLALTVLGVLVGLVKLLGLPGRIAFARKHPDAEAVYLMGWVGFVAVVPWIQALIWAFKPTDKVDIRRFPEAERKAERADLAELSAYAYGKPLPPDETDDENEKPKQAPPETGENTKSLGK